MTNIELMNFWVRSADEDFAVMEFLYKGKFYTEALFFGHYFIIDARLNIQKNKLKL